MCATNSEASSSNIADMDSSDMSGRRARSRMKSLSMRPKADVRSGLLCFFSLLLLRAENGVWAATLQAVEVDPVDGVDGATCGPGNSPCRSIEFAVTRLPSSVPSAVLLHPGRHVLQRQPDYQLCAKACFLSQQTTGAIACGSCPIGIQLAYKNVTFRPVSLLTSAADTIIDCSTAFRCFRATCPAGASLAGPSSGTACAAQTAVTIQGVTMIGGNATTVANLTTGNITQAASVGGGVIYVDGPRLTLSNVVLRDGAAVRGGAVEVASSAYPVELDGVAFINCSASLNGRFNGITDAFAADGKGRGGGIYVSQTPLVTMRGCRFEACDADEGGGLAVQQVAHTNISDSSFDSCTGWNAAGGLEIDHGNVQYSNLTVVRSNFTNLSGGWMQTMQGGGVAFQGLSSTWEDIYVDNNINYAYGGGFFFIFSPTGTTNLSSTFTRLHVGNSFGNYGGAFYIYFGSVLLIDSSFSNCTSSKQGGAIYVEAGAQVLLVDTDISNCAAGSEGGAISSSGSVLEIHGGRFFNNSAVQQGGCVYSVMTSAGLGNFTLAGATFDTCTSSVAGGAYYQFGGSNAATGLISATVENCTILNSSAVTGGGIYSVNGNLLVTNTKLDGCSAIVEGGGMYVVDNTNLTVVSSTFAQCSSRRGGAISVAQGSSISPRFASHFSGSTFRSNVATLMEGAPALYCGYDTLDFILDDVTFENNSAPALGSSGGAIVMLGETLSAKNSHFIGNSASSGGAVYMEGNGTFSASNTLFAQNSAQDMSGGALYLSTTTAFTGTSCNFSANTAKEGAAIFAQVFSTVTARNCTFLRNSASAFGGGLAIVDSATLFLASSQIINSSAQSGGAALYVSGSAKINVADSRLVSNFAGGPGGALYVASSGITLNITATSLENNYGTSGGAAYVSANTTGAIQGCTFTSNIASNVTSNIASSAGTAVDLVALGDGGGLHVVAQGIPSRLALQGLTFRHNKAGRGGAIFQDYGMDGTLSKAPQFLHCADCTGPGNTARYGNFYATAATSFEVRAVGQAQPLTTLLVTNGRLLPPFEAVLLDYYNNTVTTDTSDIAEISNPYISGTLSVVIANGTFLFQNVYATSDGSSFTRTIHPTVTITSLRSEFPGTLTRNLTFQFCPAGKYVDTSKNPEGECAPCTAGYFCTAASLPTLCNPGTYTFSSGASNASQCLPCGSGLQCGGGTFRVQQQYWANLTLLATGQQPSAYQCNLRGCQGATFTGDFSVDDGRQCFPGFKNSRLCGRCAHNYYQLLGTCKKCTSAYKESWYALVVVVVIAWILLNKVSKLFESVDIILVEMQFLVVIAGYNLNFFYGWIRVFVEVFQVSLFNLDFLGPDCIRGSYTYNNRWVFGAILPLAGVGLHLLAYSVGVGRDVLFAYFPRLKFLRPSQIHDADARFRNLVSGICNLLDILYFDTAIRCFEVFQAVRYDAKVLGADPAVLWDAHEHTSLIPYAVIYTVVYVIGFPLMLAAILWYGHATRKLYRDDFAELFGWMYERVEPRFWWAYIPTTALRRVMFAAVAVFLYTTPDMQVTVTLVLLLVFICLHYLFHPLRKSSLNVLGGLLLLGQFSYTLAGVATTYFQTPSVTRTVAASLGGAGVLLYALSSVVIIPYEIHGTWARIWVRKWIVVHSQPPAMAPPHAKGLRGAFSLFSVTPTPSSLKRTETLREAPIVDGRLVPLEEITGLFAGRVMYVFLRHATPDELKLLCQVRYHYSYHKPSDADYRRTCAILADFPKEMRFAAVAQLLHDDHSFTIYGESIPMAASACGFGGGNGGGGKGWAAGLPPSRPADAPVVVDEAADQDPGQRRLVRLRGVARQMVKERRKAPDSLRLLFNNGKFRTVAAWLIFGSHDCRVSFSRLVVAVRRHVVGLPPEVDLGKLLAEPSREDELEGAALMAGRSLGSKLRLHLLRHFP